MPALLLAVFTLLAAGILPFGGLYISSLPSGADVWVDGSYIGRTPLLIDGLREGKHSVTVTKAGWKVEEVDQNVSAGVTTPATVQLDPIKPLRAHGEIALHGLERGARISIDGGPWRALENEYAASVGTHRLSVREPLAKFERMILVYPEQTTHVLFAAPATDTQSAVVAPVSDYLPGSAAKVTGSRVVIRWGGHVAVGHLGDARFLVDKHDVVYDAPAGMVRGRLYLPLDLLLMLTGSKAK
ncbi:MAG TPA: PEGA domain-containing protein [Candidatus Baltobacteraceae bacterium]|nr:PEGA domain-containing protein [Candidatus Baltobacteraceae bacterium]